MSKTENLLICASEKSSIKVDFPCRLLQRLKISLGFQRCSSVSLQFSYLGPQNSFPHRKKMCSGVQNLACTHHCIQKKRLLWPDFSAIDMRFTLTGSAKVTQPPWTNQHAQGGGHCWLARLSHMHEPQSQRRESAFLGAEGSAKIQDW